MGKHNGTGIQEFSPHLLEQWSRWDRSELLSQAGLNGTNMNRDLITVQYYEDTDGTGDDWEQSSFMEGSVMSPAL